MIGDPRPQPTPEGRAEGPVPTALGPPGWREFQAARRRFETTLALQGLERALVAARPVPHRRRGESSP